jgi:hypothetical protein
VHSRATRGSIEADFQLESARPGTTVLLRLRHPAGKAIRSVTINGKEWHDFDVHEEWIRIPDVGGERYSIIATY